MRNYFKETDQVVRRELRRIVRQPMYWVLMVVLPVVSFAFFAAVSYTHLTLPTILLV